MTLGDCLKTKKEKLVLKKNTNRKIKEIEKEKKTINDIWNSSKLSLDAAESHIDIIATLDNDIGLVRDGKERLSKLVLEQIDLNDKKGDDKPAIQYMKRAINYYCGDYNDFNITQVKLLNFVREEEIFKTYIEGQLVYDPSVVTMYDYMWVEGKRNNGNYVFDTAYFLLAAGSAVN